MPACDLLKVDFHQPTKRFFDLLTSHYLLPTIYRATRITETTAILIDNTNAYSDCDKSGITCSDLSEHLPVILSCYPDNKRIKNKTKYVYKRCYTPDAIKKFKDMLANTDWKHIIALGKDKDVNRTYGMFYNKYFEIYNICFPIQK